MSAYERAIAFECAGEQLLGVLSLPVVARDIGVVIVVGGPQYRVGSHRQFVLMARHLARAGYPVLRFDTRGMGDSSGSFPGFENIAPDIASAAAALRQEASSLRGVVLWGRCDAAAAALISVGQVEDIAGLVLLNPWVRNAETLASVEVKHYYLQRFLEPAFWRKLLRGEVRIFSALGEFLGKVNRQLWRRSTSGGAKQSEGRGDFREQMVLGLQGFPGPVLLILSGNDFVAAEFIEFSNGHPQLQKLLQRGGVTRIDIAEADHTFSNRRSRERVEIDTLNWLEQVRSNEST